VSDDSEKAEARAAVAQAQAAFVDVEERRGQVAVRRREAFSQAREKGLTLREIGEITGLHLTRVKEVLETDFRGSP
jgi:DNA-directed RNA polymerase specialized sigma24 family protein